MARPQKQTVDYFPHDSDASDHRTITILFNHFGHEGASAWWMLLENLCRSPGHFISITKVEDYEFLAARLHFTPERLKSILDKMCYLDAIDPALYAGGIIWCQNLVDRLEPVYNQRKTLLPNKPELSVPETELSVPETELLPNETPHSKVKESKVKELKKGNYHQRVIAVDLPEWIKKEDWAAFKEMRLKIRAPLTTRATSLLLKELARLREEGDDAGEVLNQSIMNGWRGVFALKRANSFTPIKKAGGGNGANQRHPQESLTERLERSVGGPIP